MANQIINKIGTSVIHVDSTDGEITLAELKNGSIREFTINPSDIDIPVAKINEIIGGEPTENAKEIIAHFRF